jgi:hypothetical protein
MADWRKALGFPRKPDYNDTRPSDNPVNEALAAAEALAAGVRSFLSSLPFTAPESVDFQAQAKLAEPLRDYEAARGGADA